MKAFFLLDAMPIITHGDTSVFGLLLQRKGVYYFGSTEVPTTHSCVVFDWLIGQLNRFVVVGDCDFIANHKYLDLYNQCAINTFSSIIKEGIACLGNVSLHSSQRRAISPYLRQLSFDPFVKILDRIVKDGVTYAFATDPLKNFTFKFEVSNSVDFHIGEVWSVSVYNTGCFNTSLVLKKKIY